MKNIGTLAWEEARSQSIKHKITQQLVFSELIFRGSLWETKRFDGRYRFSNLFRRLRE